MTLESYGRSSETRGDYIDVSNIERMATHDQMDGLNGQRDHHQEVAACDEDDDDYNCDYEYKQVIVGICAMEKKAQSKPMKEILRRLEDYFEYIKTTIFEESIILNKPIEEWPLCDCLISFHSKGFPLSKAIEYARLRKPFLVNDLDIQYDIQDRRKVYKILGEADIELPRYAVLDRDSSNPEERELIESDDHIEVSNVVFNKPFVEKPISAEDHNICIYYPAHAGGGSQRLFRKIGCRSSVYSNESHVRKTGSYIYEEFMPTDGTDVKVYTAGPDYAHAEARKSPALDGKVERDSDGKEIRYPVILTNKEKLIARRVCLAFKQTVCGFDLLRANGRSYVCDVNGFSFVKSSMKYYEDCSKILGNMVLRALAPQLHIPWSIPFQLDDPPIVPTTFGRMMELRCVIAVIRHGDRTPKQKMKLEVKHTRFFDLFHKYGKNGQAKLKKPQQLQEVLDIARYLLGELPEKPASEEVVEPRVKLRQLKSVLEMYGHFSGINRKVQLKYQPHGRPRRSSSEDDSAREPSLVLILKWGGELTPAGRVQAEDLGRCFRRLYPASGDYSGPQGLGLLRLHSTFRHDLKIYASDEGRVQMTAAAFAKGFLALEGELTPILFQMVKSANTNGLLDNDCDSSKCQKIVKERLHDIMQKDTDLSAEDLEILNPTDSPSITTACKFIANPYQACEKVHKLIKELNALIRSKRQDNSYTQEYHLYHGETWDLLQRRWAKLEKDFKFPRTKRFDISKIPDIYDCIKYDLQHNQHTLQFEHAHELHAYAKALADIVIPQEYGMTAQEKLMIGLGTCSPLLRKIQADLLRNADSTDDNDTESVNRLDPKYSHGVSSPDRHVRTRLYFTSESHIHSLVTALQFGGLLDVKKDEQWNRSMEFLAAISELSYLSQIVIMLYEDPTKEPTSNDRFHVEIHFSSGVINSISHQNMPTEPQGPGFRPHLHNKSYSNASSSGATRSVDDKSFDSVIQTQTTATGVIKEEQLTDDDEAEPRQGDQFRQQTTTISEMADETPTPAGQGSRGVGRQLRIQQNRLSRSYSAMTPISLQELFERSADDSHDETSITTATTSSESTPRASAVGDKMPTPTAKDDTQTTMAATSTPADVMLTGEEQARQRRQVATTPAEEKVGLSYVPAHNNNKLLSSSSSPKQDGRHLENVAEIRDNVASVIPQSRPTDVGGSSCRQDDTSTTVTQPLPIVTGNTAREGDVDDLSTLRPDKVSVKNNWKAYEQYLASEWTQTPRFGNRRRRYYNQQLINLPQTYHTIHHSHFPPSTLSALRESSMSVSTSTSPQQARRESSQHSVTTTPTISSTGVVGITPVTGGVNLHQRYMAFKQQQAANASTNSPGGSNRFTISASMPIQYKSSQYPRACSVADVSQYCVGPSSLISTAVISGSSPELVAVCPYSPTIRPLETLHNELSLRQFIDFIMRLTPRNQRSTAGGSGVGGADSTSAASNYGNANGGANNYGYSSDQQPQSDSNTSDMQLQQGYGLQQQHQRHYKHRQHHRGHSLRPGSESVNSSLQHLDNNNSSSSSLAAPTVASRASCVPADKAKKLAANESTSTPTPTTTLPGQHLESGTTSADQSGSQQQQQLQQSLSQMALSPGGSLSNSLIWSGPPSSFASGSSAGPSSPGGAGSNGNCGDAYELWSRLELDEEDQRVGNDDDDDEEEDAEDEDEDEDDGVASTRTTTTTAPSTLTSENGSTSQALTTTTTSTANVTTAAQQDR